MFVMQHKKQLKRVFFFQLGFTPCKAEPPLRGMVLPEKEAQKRLKHTGNVKKELSVKICLLIPDVKPLRS